MRTPARILIVDDTEDNRAILERRLKIEGYQTVSAVDGEAGIEAARAHAPDLILLDVMMPKLDGFEVCRRLKADPSLPYMPIVLLTAKTAAQDIVTGLNAGADDYLTKPVDQVALVARVRAILRTKALHDQVQEQAAKLEDWNRTLERRVADQLAEIERIGRLKRFLSPHVADLVSAGEEKVLDSHRRDVAVVFCDLRGFTAFAETAEPEEVMHVLREYHDGLGALIHAHDGTLERFVGDGLMVLFNDPLPCPDPPARAVKLAVAMRARVAGLAAGWRKHGHELGFGVGIARGYATLGRIGFEGRFDYAAIGSVPNLAARLCGEALDGQILIDSKVAAAVESLAEVEAVGALTLKGFHRPIPAHNVARLKGA